MVGAVNGRDVQAKAGAEGLKGLARTMTKRGYATRRQAEEMVRSGRVKVEGKRVLDPGFGVTGDCVISIDDVRMSEVIRSYFALNKPLDVATNSTVSPRARLISTFMPSDIPGLAPAGRLDPATTGLLLVSNDAEWNALAASGHGFDKEFRLQVAGAVSELQLGVVRAGVHVPKAGVVKPKSIELIGHQEGLCDISLVLPGGKVRQIRSLFTALRLDLRAVHRIRIGPIRLDNIAPGRWRSLSREEVELIRRGPSGRG